MSLDAIWGRAFPGAVPTASQRIWLIGEGAVAARAAEHFAERAIGSGEIVIQQATLIDAQEAVQPNDWAMLAGLPARETVEAAEVLLSRGIPTALIVTDRPVLRRSLGRKAWGLDCILLSPTPSSRLDSAALRLRDILASGGALLAAGALFAVLGVLIRRSSPGPVFYTAEVIGRAGKPFVWRKLRTMRLAAPQDDTVRREQFRAFLAGEDQSAAAEKDDGTAKKIVDESRITPIGRILRRHSVDELPQLWNVLMGDMTLVGPRPCLPYEYELMSPWQRLRYRVTPGLTGPWQAYGRSQVTFDEMALMDYCYGRTKSFWRDLRIILRTVRVVLTGEGGK